MTKIADMDPGLQLAIQKAGSLRKLALLVGVSLPSVVSWRRLPDHRILQIEAVTGIPREQLRPDLYRPASDGGSTMRDEFPTKR